MTSRFLDKWRARAIRRLPGLRRRLRSAGLPVPVTPVNRRFRAMDQGAGPWQWAEIAEADRAFERDKPARLLAMLAMLEGGPSATAIDRLQHCLQAATRAERDGRSDSYVACALLHDVGAALAPRQHGEFAALLLRPHISDDEHWMLVHHQVFQSWYYFHHFGMDRNGRDQYRDHPAWAMTEEFVRLYDQTAFDPDYDTFPLEHFRPLLERVFAG